MYFLPVGGISNLWCNKIYCYTNLWIGKCFKWICILLNTAYDNEATTFISKWVGLKCERCIFMQLIDGAQSTHGKKDLCFSWVRGPSQWDPLLNVSVLFRSIHLWVFHFSYGFQYESLICVLRMLSYILPCPMGAIRCHFIVASEVVSEWTESDDKKCSFLSVPGVEFHAHDLQGPGPALFYSMVGFVFFF